MKKLRVLVTDDHKLVRNGIRFTLMSGDIADHIERIDDASNGREAVQRVAVFDYDIIFMDVHMPEMNGIQATSEILKKNCDSGVIAISMYDEIFEIKSMLKAGARGYLLKNSGSETLSTAINTVVSGGKYYCNEVAQRLIDEETGRSNRAGAIRKKLLTDREVEILKMIATGMSSGEISDALAISRRTVDTHRTNILLKLEVKNTAGMLKYAVKMGY